MMNNSRKDLVGELVSFRRACVRELLKEEEMLKVASIDRSQALEKLKTELRT